MPSTLAQAYERCINKERLCFGLPKNCIDSKSCKVLYSSYSMSESNGTVQMELFWSRDKSSDNKWVAMALSPDGLMGGDSVTECILRDDGTINIKQGWNPKNHDPTENVDNITGFTTISTSDVDSLLNCKWTRNGITLVKGITFDIVKDKYYLSLAYGPMSSGIKNDKKLSQGLNLLINYFKFEVFEIKYLIPNLENSIAKHVDKIMSASAIDLQSIGIVKASEISLLIKLHG